MSLITENFLASHGKVLYKKKRKRCVESYENAILNLLSPLEKLASICPAFHLMARFLISQGQIAVFSSQTSVLHSFLSHRQCQIAINSLSKLSPCHFTKIVNYLEI